MFPARAVAGRQTKHVNAVNTREYHISVNNECFSLHFVSHLLCNFFYFTHFFVYFFSGHISRNKDDDITMRVNLCRNQLKPDFLQHDWTGVGH